VAIISGLVVQLPLVLLAMPAFFMLMRRGRQAALRPAMASASAP
jgi:hypothetical protein